ncbi:MAG: hypothetical protein V2I50_12025, partial [Desulfuromusa sp.]|nr:hypothetical protein [Desulfuromusa sp.]
DSSDGSGVRYLGSASNQILRPTTRIADKLRHAGYPATFRGVLGGTQSKILLGPSLWKDTPFLIIQPHSGPKPSTEERRIVFF